MQLHMDMDMPWENITLNIKSHKHLMEKKYWQYNDSECRPAKI